MTFLASFSEHMSTSEYDFGSIQLRESALEAKAARLHELVRLRDRHFRCGVMADAPMAIMLMLFQSELQSISLSQSNLILLNLLDEEEAASIIEKLVHAGLIVVTGDNPARRTVGLSALGSARMRSFISDFPVA